MAAKPKFEQESAAAATLPIVISQKFANGHFIRPAE